eukprot:TRINITY_DN1924_c0_g1_i3.p1 TRINITY_DN1924_c0_g1~~TRINITY_DN1924_c0_g1_i3.p1  ORF type:complete len:100 (+),score=15.61 TRINITY_DN1924_c0_g1_i3:992-1291(+)
MQLYTPNLIQFYTKIRNDIFMNNQPIPENWRKNPSEFRPITLMDNQYRAFAHSIYVRILKHVNKNKIISPFQTGSIKGKSTADNILTINAIIEDANTGT